MAAGFNIDYIANKSSIVNPSKIGIFTRKELYKYAEVYSAVFNYAFDKYELNGLSISDPTYHRKIKNEGWMLRGGIWVYDVRLCSIQHSPRPNCDMYTFTAKEANAPEVQIITRRNVIEGEELTLDLFKELDPDFIETLRDRLPITV